MSADFDQFQICGHQIEGYVHACKCSYLVFWVMYITVCSQYVLMDMSVVAMLPGC